MSREEKNLLQLARFEDLNSAIINRAPNGNKSFRAIVSFSYGSQEIKDTLDAVVQKTTWEAGRLSFSDGENITAESHHTEFVPVFNDWHCTDNGTLTISGNSPKLGTTYKATIIAVA